MLDGKTCPRCHSQYTFMPEDSKECPYCKPEDFLPTRRKSKTVRPRKEVDAAYVPYWFRNEIRGKVRSAIGESFMQTYTFIVEYMKTTPEELHAKLGEQPPGMVLDHICPCSQAKTEEEFLCLQHIDNLRWLPDADNRSKSNSRTPEGEALCIKLLGRPWID
jgi:hypothetical protein